MNETEALKLLEAAHAERYIIVMVYGVSVELTNKTNGSIVYGSDDWPACIEAAAKWRPKGVDLTTAKYLNRQLRRAERLNLQLRKDLSRAQEILKLASEWIDEPDDPKSARRAIRIAAAAKPTFSEIRRDLKAAALEGEE